MTETVLLLATLWMSVALLHVVHMLIVKLYLMTHLVQRIRSTMLNAFVTMVSKATQTLMFAA